MSKHLYITDRTYRIKDDAWNKFVQECMLKGEKINHKNPGPQRVKYAPVHMPFHESIMLNWPLWWFHESELEEVEE